MKENQIQLCSYCFNEAVTWVGKLCDYTDQWLYYKNLCQDHYEVVADVLKAENADINDWDFESVNT